MEENSNPLQLFYRVSNDALNFRPELFPLPLSKNITLWSL